MARTISEKISELRKTHALTQEQLGTMLGVSSQAVSKWEKGDTLPDILLLPKLCTVLEISIDALLDMPTKVADENTVFAFCKLAAQNGESATFLHALSRMFPAAGSPATGSWIDSGSNYLRIFDCHGMGFVVSGKTYLDECLANDTEDIQFILRILCDQNILAVLRTVSMDAAVTKADIGSQTGLDEPAINQILTGLFKRGMIVCDKDRDGKRGYLLSDAMAGVYMILAGCQVLSDRGAIHGCTRFSRVNTEPSDF